MTERRAARALQTATGRRRYLGNELPPDLAGGPCIEDWIEGQVPPDYHGNKAQWRAHRTLRLWNAAVDEWAESTGWAHEGRPASNARNLARIRHPWSREFLAERDPKFLAWLEGELDVHPGRNGPAFQPTY